MPSPEERIQKDSGHPCPFCGNFTYVDVQLTAQNGPIFVEALDRSFAEKLKGRAKSKLKARVCTHCGAVRGFATELDVLLDREKLVPL